MEYLGVIGFMLAGYILPELLQILGNGDHYIPRSMNIIAALSVGLISASFLIN